MTLPDQAPAGPYGAWAPLYWKAGWRGVLPLPPRRKASPPTGWTGRGAPDPSYPDLQAWADLGPSNIALRMPADVIGIDVDAYGEKHGGGTIAVWEAAAGTLPATWRSTARDDGVSGIRFYRIPPGLRWPGELQGGDVELIQHVHRYAVVGPSIHPSGATYRWYGPDGQVAISPPSPSMMAELPAEWVRRLTGGEADMGTAKTRLGSDEISDWLTAVPHASEEPCGVMAGLAGRRPGGSWHEGIRDSVLAVVGAGARGHWGLIWALDSLCAAFLAEVTPRRSDPDEVLREFRRMVLGAVEIVAGDDPVQECNCHGEQDAALEEWVRAASGSDAFEMGPTVPLVAPDVPGEALPVDRPTWSRVDLAQFVTGAYRAPEPDLLPRTDGLCLFYSGQTHSVHGESESGKSLVAQIAAALQLRIGRRVLYVDFESDANQIVGRMLQLGCSPEQITTLFDYRQPERSPRSPGELATWVDMMGQTYALAVIDGVTDALGVFGVGSGSATKDNDAITVWARQFPRLLAAKTGAAVVMIDHVVKNGADRGRFAIGGQAKMAALTGAAYSAQMTKTLGMGLIGEVTLRIGKDRPGGIRPHCGPFRSADQTQEAAIVEIDSTGDITNWTIHTPKGSVGDEAGEFRPTALMQKVSEFLATLTDLVSARTVREEVPGKERTILTALEVLVNEGYVSREAMTGRRGGGLGHRLVKPYFEGIEVVQDA